MAKTVDILRYILGLDAKPFRREARRVDKDVRKLKGGVDKSAKSFGGLQAAVVGAAAAFAALKLAGIIKGATLVAARIEVLNNVFELTGKAAGNTSAELEFTKQKLVSLGIAEKEALQIGLRFIQVQLDLADSLKIARAAQDLAVVAGTDSSTTALALTNAIVKQRPILLKQFGIVANLDEIFGKMAKTLGKTTAELTENERRTAFLNTILEKAKTVAGSYEKAMELVGKRLTSLPRHFQNAQKAVGQHFLPAMRVAVDGAAEFLQIITEGFQTAEQDFTKNLFKFAKGFDKFAASRPKIAALREEFVELTKQERLTIPQQERLNKVIEELGELLPEVRGILRGYKDDIKGATGALDGLVQASEAVQRFKLLSLLLDQAKAFELNTRRIKEFEETGTGVFGIVALNLREAEKDLKNFGSTLIESVAQLARVRKELAAPGLTSLERTGIENRIKVLTNRIRDNQRALKAASRDVIIYTGQIGLLNAANLAQVENFAKLFPNLRTNAILIQALTLTNKEFLDSVLAIIDAQKVAQIVAKTGAAIDLFGLGPARAKPFPSGQSDEERRAADRERRARQRGRDEVKSARDIELLEKRRNRLLEKRAKLIERQEKARQRAESRRTADERSRQRRADRLERQRIESAARITGALDVLSIGLSFIDQQMSDLVTRAADFVETLATGDIFSKLSAGIGLVGTALGLISGGGPSREEVLEQRAGDRARRLEESQDRLRQALDQLKDAIIGETIESTQAELDLLLEARNLFNELTLGSDKLGLDEFVDMFDRLNEILRQFGLDPVFRESDPFGGGFTFGQGGINQRVFDAFNAFFQEVFDTLRDAGLALEPFRSTNEFQSMINILEDIARSGGLQGEVGLDLIRFWTTFGDLTLAQQEELLNALLAGVESSGDITRDGLLELLSQLETLGDQIEAEEEAAAAEGLTQIQRSVTTITEGQANIIAATLNSILSVLGLMDTKLGQIVTGLIGTESGGLLGGVGAPLATIPEFGFELPEMLASLLGIEEKLGSFLDRVAASIGPTITVESGAITINQNFPGVTERIEVEEITSSAITEAIIASGRAEGIKV